MRKTHSLGWKLAFAGVGLILMTLSTSCSSATTTESGIGRGAEPSSAGEYETYSLGGYTWRVLDTNEDFALIITEEIVETRRFDDDSADWASSEIRSYLNGEFLGRFSEEEQSRVIASEVTGTEDRVFLLSVEEVQSYFYGPEDCYAFYDAEKYGPNDIGYKYLGDVERYWWLRTPGAAGVGVSVAGSDGPLSPEEDNVALLYYGVRPAMIIRTTTALQKGTAATPPRNDAQKQATPKPESAEPQIPDGAIKWTEARNHVGESVTVFGPVAGSKYASTSNGEPTFIDIGARYPDPGRVSVVVWGEDRHNFSGSPEEMYLGKTISVTGEVYIYGDACNIEVQSPSQIRVIEE